MSKKVPKYELETIQPVFADISENNEVIVEDAGFIPLDVKFKRFEQAGIAMQFQTSEFTSNDMRNLYANPDFEIYPDDEFEEVQEKLAAYNAYRIKYMQDNKLGAFAESKSPSQQAERASSAGQETTKKEETLSE